MSSVDSTSPLTPSKTDKPDRPEGSPLFWHATGRWAKKIRGKLEYFGRGSHDEALALYNEQAAELHSGRQSRDEETGGITVRGLCVRFLAFKLDQRDNGDLAPRSFVEYGETCKRLIKVFGRGRPVSDLRPDDFAKLRKKMAKTWGPARLKSEIIRSRVVFNWAFKEGRIDRVPVMGSSFAVPSAKTLRKHRAKSGPKMFESDECHKLLAAAGQPLRSMILLGLNCGFGNGDVGKLPIDAVDLESGWVRFPRPKTGVDRKCPLWPETVAAIRESLTLRHSPADPADSGFLFITHKKAAWRTDGATRPLSHEFTKLMRRAGLDGHRGFYALRHTFQTIADECGDFLAVRQVMGHSSNDIADSYRERMSDDRLRKATECVRQWLLAAGPIDGGTGLDVLPFAAKAV